MPLIRYIITLLYTYLVEEVLHPAAYVLEQTHRLADDLEVAEQRTCHNNIHIICINILYTLTTVTLYVHDIIYNVIYIHIYNILVYIHVYIVI